MRDDREPLDALLRSVSEGTPVDWDAALSGLPNPDRARGRNLQDVARIAAFHRDLQGARGDAGPDPERWGPLQVLDRIGSGASADVYRAWDPSLRREVALKLLRQTGPGQSAALLAEGRAAARIRHPNVVTVHGIAEHDGRIGLWMGLIAGRRLGEVLERSGPLAPDELERLGREIGAALAAVHATGLLHRDLKPDNVVRDLDGTFILADFGLGMRRDGAAPNPPGASGTPMYMAPELLQGGPPTERSDLYGLGMLLRFAALGRHPFAAETIDELLREKVRGPLEDLEKARPDLPAPVVQAIDRAGAPESASRFESVAAFLAATGPVAAREPGPGRLQLAMVMVVLVAAVLLGTWVQRAVDGGHQSAGAAPLDVAARLLRHDPSGASDLGQGDPVAPGDLLSMELSLSRPSWVYVLNEDDRGERYLLFPQPMYDLANPLPAGEGLRIPGRRAGLDNAWVVTSVGDQEHFLLVVSPEPVPALETELGRMRAPSPDAPIEHAPVAAATVEQLRGVGGVQRITASTPTEHSPLFAQFRPLAGREYGVRGIWVRQFRLRNPG